MREWICRVKLCWISHCKNGKITSFRKMGMRLEKNINQENFQQPKVSYEGLGKECDNKV